MKTLKNRFLNSVRQFVVFIIYLSMMAGCVTTESHRGLQSAILPELIPRESFFDNSKLNYNYQISPDGQQVAWLAAQKGYITVFIKEIDSNKIKIINTKTWCHISWYRWAQDSRHIIYKIYSGPKNADHIYYSDSQFPNSDSVNLTPDALQQASFLGNSVFDKDQILVSQKKYLKGDYDFYKLNLSSRTEELFATNLETSIIQWIPDLKGNLKGCIRSLVSGLWQLELYDLKKKTWKPLARWKADEFVKCVGVTPDKNGFWLLSNKGRDRISLVRFDIKSKKQMLICEDPDADIEDVYISPVTGKALFAYSCPDYPKTWVLDPQLEKDFAVFKKKSPVGIQIVNMDDQEKKWTVKVFDEKKESYFLYDRSSKKKQFLGESKWIDDIEPLAKTCPVNIQSRDNLILRGYLTRPTGTQNVPLPMVLFVHGGPWARDYWQPDQMVQFLANRGYVVLQVNFRGSKGYGRSFKKAAIKEFSKGMHADLIDSVNWAVGQKIADPEKIAIVGGSYGGFAAMAGLTFTPDVFACAVSINGVSNWNDYISSFPASLPLYMKRGYEIWYEYVGNPEKIDDEKDIALRSPIHFVDHVKKPIFIIYGDQDRNVSPAQSIRMIESLKRYQKEVEYMKFENEGHGIHWAHNSVRMYQKIEIFLARHLGGRSDG